MLVHLDDYVEDNSSESVIRVWLSRLFFYLIGCFGLVNVVCVHRNTVYRSKQTLIRTGNNIIVYVIIVVYVGTNIIVYVIIIVYVGNNIIVYVIIIVYVGNNIIVYVIIMVYVGNYCLCNNYCLCR